MDAEVDEEADEEGRDEGGEVEVDDNGVKETDDKLDETRIGVEIRSVLCICFSLQCAQSSLTSLFFSILLLCAEISSS